MRNEDAWFKVFLEADNLNNYTITQLVHFSVTPTRIAMTRFLTSSFSEHLLRLEFLLLYK